MGLIFFDYLTSGLVLMCCQQRALNFFKKLSESRCLVVLTLYFKVYFKFYVQTILSYELFYT